jgi:hypothetical protein
LRPKQPDKEENTPPSRRLVQGRSIWRGVGHSALLSAGRIGNAIRLPCSARTEEREISLTVLDPGDVSTLRLHRSSFSGITLSAMEGHTLILNAPWREHGLKRGVFQMPQFPQILLARNTLSRQSKGCVSRNVTLRRAVVAAIDEASPDPFDSVHRFVLRVLSEIPLILRAPRLSCEFSFEIFVAQEG